MTDVPIEAAPSLRRGTDRQARTQQYHLRLRPLDQDQFRGKAMRGHHSDHRQLAQGKKNPANQTGRRGSLKKGD